MKAKVLTACHIDGDPKKEGAIVDVCANTLRNLIRDGKLEEVTEESSESQESDSQSKPKKGGK